MDAYQKVKDKLDELGIEFDVVEHPPAFTTEQADSYIEGLEGVRTKTMFLTNKKKTQYYLLIMDARSHWIWMISKSKWKPTGSAWLQQIL